VELRPYEEAVSISLFFVNCSIISSFKNRFYLKIDLKIVLIFFGGNFILFENPTMSSPNKSDVLPRSDNGIKNHRFTPPAAPKKPTRTITSDHMRNDRLKDKAWTCYQEIMDGNLDLTTLDDENNGR